MTASTQILAFTTEAAGSGGNRLSPTAYAALTTLLQQGFQAGTAQSVQVNTVLAQTSFMAAGLANWMVAQGISVPDDGNLTNLVSEISAALTTFNATTAGRSVVGSMRNGKMSVTTASATATFTADEIIVESALGGSQYQLASYNQTINLATTGAGGMDTGTAPVSGFVALYAIYGTAGTSILATDATSAAAPNVYGGAYMPTGYTASALISVWPTNGSGQFLIGTQRDRVMAISDASAGNQILSTSTQQASPVSLLAATYVPLNAKSVMGNHDISSTANSSMNAIISSDTHGTGAQRLANQGTSTGVPFQVTITTAQTIYYTAVVSAGTMTYEIDISGYTF